MSGEWIILYLSQIPKVVFLLLMFRFVTGSVRSLKRGDSLEETVRDKTVFYAAHYAGLFCGAIGLWTTFMKFLVNTSIENLKNLVLYYNGFIFVPYCLIAFYWLFMKRREKITEWYDEKQFINLSRAGLITLIVTLPALGIPYAMEFFSPGVPAGVLWFPFYLHAVLTLFS